MSIIMTPFTELVDQILHRFLNGRSTDKGYKFVGLVL